MSIKKILSIILKNWIYIKKSLQKNIFSQFFFINQTHYKIEFLLKVSLKEIPSKILQNWIYIKGIFERYLPQFLYLSHNKKKWIYTKGVSWIYDTFVKKKTLTIYTFILKTNQ